MRSSRGETSRIIQVFIQDSTSTTGAGLTGLTYGTAGLVAYYHRDDTSTATAITLVDATVGTWTSGGFKRIDDTNLPGWYELHLPDAALTTGKSVSGMLKGATNMVPTPFYLDIMPRPLVVKGEALANFFFTMVLSSDGRTAAAGKTVTAERAIDAGSFAACSNAVVEVGSGAYRISLSTTDTDGTKVLLKFSEATCDTKFIQLVPSPR